MKTTELPAEQLQSGEEKRVQEKVHIIKNMMQMASKLKQSEAFRKVRKDQILTRTEKKKKPGVAKGTKRGMYNKDGSLRKKPGPKVKNSQALKDN